MKNKINLKLILIFLLIFGLSIFFFSYGSDFYWHAKAGEYILKNKQIPFIDVFSWYGSTNNLHWISHEWLFEIIIYLFTLISPKYGPIIYIGIMNLLLGLTIYKLNEKQFITFPFYMMIWGLLSIIFFIGVMLPRPQLFSYLFFTLTILIVKNIIENENSKLFFTVPLITILWANIHGGSSNLGYTVYILVIIASILPIKSKLNLTKKQLLALLCCFITSFLFIAINPHGIKMIIYPYQNITSSTMLNCINEWKGLNFLNIRNLGYTIFIIIVIFNIFKNYKKLSLLDLLLLFPFLIIGIKSIKLLPYFYIVSTYIIPNWWSNTKFKINLNVIIFFLIIAIIFVRLNIYKSNDFELVNDEMINYIKDNKDLKLYNSYDLGGYLIYKDINVFIDGRADMYLDTIFCDACKIEKGKNVKVINKYDFDMLIVLNGTKIKKYLKNNDNYTLVLSDKHNSLFVKKAN